MGGWGVFLGLRIFFLKIFHTKIKSVQNGLKCKKTHKIFFPSEQLLPQTRPESDGPGRYSTARSAFGVFKCKQSEFPHKLKKKSYFIKDFKKLNRVYMMFHVVLSKGNFFSQRF